MVMISTMITFLDLNEEVTQKLMDLIQSQICASCIDNNGQGIMLQSCSDLNPTSSVISS